MTRKTLLIVAGLAAVAFVLLAVTCGGSPAEEEPDRRSRTERQDRQNDTAERGSAARGGPLDILGRRSFAGLLELIPDNPQSRDLVYINDYSRVADAFNVRPPEDDDEALMRYLGDICCARTGMRVGPWISGFSGHAPSPFENREHLAFSIRNVDQSIMTGTPPGVLEVIKGTFDPEATDRAINRCSECPPPDREEHRGMEFYSWGRDLAASLPDRMRPPAFDQLGRGGRIAVLDSFVFRTVETPGMRSLISTYLGMEESLGDDPDMSLAARKMDELELYSGLIMGNVEWLSLEGVLENACAEAAATQTDCDQLKARMEETGVLDEYDVLGAGVGVDGDGPFVSWIFVYLDEREARRNVPVFERIVSSGASLHWHQPWSELFSDAEVWSTGRVLIAKLRAENLRIWETVVLNRDSLLLHH